jgi:hypothetical protein
VSLQEEGVVTVLRDLLTFEDQESRDTFQWVQPPGVHDNDWREGVRDSFDCLDGHLATLL